MTGSQYKNILDWSLYMKKELAEEDNITVMKRLFDNLGVAFPNGNHQMVLTALNTKSFLGWRSCSLDEAQQYANLGFATIAVNDKEIVLIYPNKNINNLSDNTEMKTASNRFVKHVGDISEEDRNTMKFYAYRYGFALEKKS